MSQQQAAYDSLAGLWYRYDESLRGMVYLHPETGAILRRKEEHEKRAENAFAESLNRVDASFNQLSVSRPANYNTVAGSSENAGPSLSAQHRAEDVAVATQEQQEQQEQQEDEEEKDESIAGAYAKSGTATKTETVAEEYYGPPKEQILIGPKANITDPLLLQHGHEARLKVKETKGNRERLDPNFKRQLNPTEFFKVGRVIKVLWPELAGYNIDNMTVVTTIAVDSRFKRERIITKIRWFVVIKEGEKWCTCLPISTYNGRGLVGKDLPKWQHSMIYTGRNQPDLLTGEQPAANEPGMRLAIRVEPNSRQDRMDTRSRLHYGKLYTIEHNVKVYDFGMVHRDYLRAFWSQWRDVMFGTVSEASSSSQNQSSFQDLPPPPERSREDSQVTFIDYAVAKRTYRITEDAKAGGQISIEQDDRIGIISYPGQGWAQAYNQATRDTGLVWKDFLLLDSEE